MRWKTVLPICLVLLLISSCSKKRVENAALKQYVLQLDELRKTDLEESAVSAFQAVSGKKHRGDKILYQTLKDGVLPQYSAFYARLQKIRPQTSVLSNLHYTYSEGARYQLLAFSNISAYLVNQEAESQRRYNELSHHAAALIGKWRLELDTLLRERAPHKN